MGGLLAAALVLSSPDAGEAWQQVSKNDHLTVWTRAVPGERVKAIKAAGLIDAPAGAVFAVLDDFARYAETMPYTDVSRVLESDPAGRETYFYTVINPPLVAKRDYTLKATVVAPSDGTYRITWETANHHPKAPAPPPGVTRLDAVSGSWELRSFSLGKTFAIYHLDLDPGGAIPALVANQANMDGVGALYEALRTWSKRPPYNQQK